MLFANDFVMMMLVIIRICFASCIRREHAKNATTAPVVLVTVQVAAAALVVLIWQ